MALSHGRSTVSRHALISVAVAVVAACLVTIALLVARNKVLDEAVFEMKMEQSDQAVPKLAILANLGDTTAQWILADLYAFGRGVPKDDEKAIYWYRRAGPMLEEADPSVTDPAAPSMYYVGKEYLGGSGVGRDEKEARKWFERAAKGGFTRAHEELGRTDKP